MADAPNPVWLFHITDVTNLPGILAAGGLLCDAAVQNRAPTVIGYDQIKRRRLTEIRVPCCDDRFVGEFVPFYYCPRSPMLYTINLGNTGRRSGCQQSIVHLVSSVGAAVALARAWAISDGNAGAFHTAFYADLEAIAALDWAAIDARYWSLQVHQKQAEFLVADFYPWTSIHAIGCHNEATADQVRQLLAAHTHQPKVNVKPDWYY